MSTAALLEGWEEWDGAWEDGGSVIALGPNDLHHPLIEIYVFGEWVDITGFVRWRQGVNIRRGRSSEAQQVDTSSCSMTLDNRDGRFSQRNPLSPYYGQLKVNTPIRVAVVRNGVTRYRFHGEVSEWNLQWDRSANDDVDDRDVTVDILASGIIRRLTQNSEPLKSAMFRNVTRLDDTTDVVVGYWPLEEASGANQFSSGISNGKNAQISGDGPTAQGFTEFACSDGGITLTQGAIGFEVSDYTAGSTQFIRWLMDVPDTAPSTTQTIIRVITTGSLRTVTFQMNSSGNVRLLIQDSTDDTVIYDSGFLVPLIDLLGHQLVCLFRLTQNGSDVDFRMELDDLCHPVAWSPISLSFYSISNTVASQTMGRFFKVQFGNNFGLQGWSLAHVLVVNGQAVFGELTSAGCSALLAYAGENPTERVRRLCAEEKVPFVTRTDGQVGNTVGMGFQRPKALMDLIRESFDTDNGLLFEPRDQLAIGYRSRLSLYNQATAVDLDYGQSDLGDSPLPVDDDRYIVNDVFANNESAPTADVNVRAVRETGPRNVQDPSVDDEGVGRYQGSVNVNITTDQTNGVGADSATATLMDQANWAVHQGAWDEERYPEVQLDLHRAALVDDVSTTNRILSADIGDRYDIDNMPEWTKPEQTQQIIQGYNEFIGGSTLHSITYQGVPFRPWTVAFMDSSFEGFSFRMDTEDTVLATDIDSTQTSFTVAVDDEYLWTLDAAQLTIGIMVGGERMLITGVSGASSPQTFTVNRSQNGIVKSHLAGTRVRLYQPATIQL